MIIKIKPYKRPDFLRLMNYMTAEEEKLLNEAGQTFTIKHNLKGKNIEDYVTHYKKNEGFRLHKRKNQNYLTHEIISFHKEETVTLEQLEELTQQYIAERNPNGIFFAVPHFDKHPHVHICVSSIEYRSGKSLRMSKGQFQNLKKNIQQYQQDKYPELSKSIVEHGRNKGSKVTDKEFQLKLRTGRQTDKEKIFGILQTSYSNALSKSLFFENLSANDVSTYSRNGRLTGVVYKRRKFRFSRLGFDLEKLNALDKSQNRLKEIRDTRGRKGKGMDRNI